MPSESDSLKSQLARRHITMISMGGVIGGGLFVGSGTVIGLAGPGAVLGYLAAGLLVIIIIRMLAEMASARPALGSFAEYARTSIGEWAGFSTGWLYVYQWIIAIAMEVIAGANIAHIWLPQVDVWVIGLVILFTLTMANVFSARSFGEIETWLSSVKIATIIVFILLGITAVVGGFGSGAEQAIPAMNLKGIFPEGIGAVLAVFPVVIVAFYGSEVATIAAAESNEPKENVARATNSIVIRVMLFYVVSLLLVVLLVPWNDPAAMSSPFASALNNIGISWAKDAMNIVILTAVLSCLNSGIFASSRMVFALANRGVAPKALVKTTKRGVPLRSVLLVTSGGYIAVAMAVIFPKTVFSFLINSAGAVAILIYLSITVSHLRMRRELDRDPAASNRLKMYGFPWFNYLAIGILVTVLIQMGVVKETRSQLFLTLCTVAAVLGAYGIQRLHTSRRNRSLAVPAEELLPPIPSSATEPIHAALQHVEDAVTAVTTPALTMAIPGSGSITGTLTPTSTSDESDHQEKAVKT